MALKWLAAHQAVRHEPSATWGFEHARNPTN
jgi:hypothetical protein